MNDAPQIPELSILITAHNEAEVIEATLESIRNQDFPMERVEVLLVDDRSTDGTGEAALALGLAGLRVIRVDDLPEGLTARQAALDLGLREARGEIVLLTDAGAQLPRDWVREMSGHLSYRDGAVIGPVIHAGRPRLLARFQTLDSLVLFTIYRWAARHGRLAGLSGANTALRREAYLATGGFPSIGFAASEELALGGALARGGWTLRYLTRPTVRNPSCSSLKALVGQARRKTRGGSRLMLGLGLLIILTNLGLIAAALVFGGIWLPVLAARYVCGLLVQAMIVSQYETYQSIKDIWLYEPMFTLLGAWVLISNAVAPHWRWGGLTYGRHGLVGKGS